MEKNKEKEEPEVVIFAPQREFVLPYIERALEGSARCVAHGERSDAALAIMLSGTEIYSADEGEMLGEDSATSADSEMAKAEETFLYANSGRRTVILRCANTVGTGMGGYMRSLAETIYRGVLFHFPDNTARLSVVHAAAVAEVCRAIVESPEKLGDGKVFNLTDGEHPFFHDLVEALAFRMSNKRVSTLSTVGQKWLGRMLYGKRRYRRMTSTLTFDDSKLRGLIDVPAVSVTEYLRTHNYDENSL
ncbi:MAG: hypothetical protein K2L16_02185 [Muribaculaceae bacterium]|nr:hypothetical protein [Muribaculaceae bacterium]